MIKAALVIVGMDSVPPELNDRVEWIVKQYNDGYATYMDGRNAIVVLLAG